MFHDVFGHVPMLTDPVYADYMQEYGRAGWKAMRYNRLKALGALYWYTVEFGLILEEAGLRAYGAGILSGPAEAVFCLEAESPNRIMLNVDRVMRTDYVIDDLQPTYFVIESFRKRHHDTVERDFDRLYRSLGPSFTYANTAVIDIDDVLHRGTQRIFPARREGQRRKAGLKRLAAEQEHRQRARRDPVPGEGGEARAADIGDKGLRSPPAPPRS